jgi:hypothetical protein
MAISEINITNMSEIFTYSSADEEEITLDNEEIIQ